MSDVGNGRAGSRSGDICELEFDAIGAGSALAILHGLFGSRNNWRTIARTLARQHRVYRLDARNHGRSPHAESMTYAEQVADLLGWMADQALANCSLIGHSMGGKTAMLLALLHPARVTRLVVVDIAPVSYGHDSGQAALLAAMRELDLAEIHDRAQADRALSRSVSDPALRAFVLHNLARSPFGGFTWRINLPGIAAALPALRGFPTPEGTPSYPGPTLLLRGAASQYVDDSGLESLYALFPRAQVETISGAGHWLHAEQPNQVADRIARFLECGD